MQTQRQSRKPTGRLRIKLEPPTCDQCRLEKISCKAPESVDERCGQCEEKDVLCLWSMGPRPSGRSPPSPSYVSYLESQVGKLERKLREILPGVNLNRELETLAQTAPPPPRSAYTSPTKDQLQSSPQRTVPNIQDHFHGVDAAPLLLKQVRLASDVKTESPLPYVQGSPHVESPEHMPLRQDSYWSETTSTRPKEPRFHGQSSGEILLRDAKEFKQEYAELSLSSFGEASRSPAPNPTESAGPSSRAPYQFAEQPLPPRAKPPRINKRRPEFWRPTPPEQRALARDIWSCTQYLSPQESAHLLPDEVLLPPPDLLRSLVELFFLYLNPFFPILHRGTFEQELAQGTHLAEVLRRRAVDSKSGINPDSRVKDCIGPEIDQSRGAGTFARVVLLVCACASRWSGDPRVLMDCSEEDEAGKMYGLNSLSAGYRYFRQVSGWSRTLCPQAGLYDVQIFSLASIFLHGSSAHYGAWIVVGVGIRIAQDVGAHRKKDGNSIEDELLKRTFWSLLVLDRVLSGSLGRPSAMQDLDSDLENPIEVDDEYWPVGGQPNQPPGKPSRLAFFSCLIGLCRIVGRALQTTFAIARTKQQMGLVGYEKEGMLLKDLRRHMKQWELTVPPHLRLPHPDQFIPSIFLDQAVLLWTVYHNIAIQIHKPFITGKTCPLTAECLQVCRTSARACAKIVDGHLKLSKSEVLPNTINGTFSSAMVLLLDLLATKQAEKSGTGRGSLTTGEPYETWEKIEDIERCMRVLARAETRWHIAGRLHDILREFRQSDQILVSLGSAGSSVSSASTQTPSPRNPTDASRPSPSSSAAATFDLDLSPVDSPSKATGSTHQMNPRPSVQPTATPTYDHLFQFPEQCQDNYPSFARPYDPAFHAQPAATDVVHPEPIDRDGFDMVPYLPDVYYGGNPNLSFPGIVPQLFFGPMRGQTNDPEWPDPVHFPSSTSQWTTMSSNTTNQAESSQPPRR